jgi:predicted phosphate transport protein (TIGR00153 family)
MTLKFMPREERFFELFNEQTGNLVRGAELLVKLVADHTQAEDVRRQIEEVEHQGDITTHEIADRLNRTFNTPFDHEDIHDLAARLDDVLDNIEATADRMFLYEAGRAGAEMVTLAENLSDATKALASAVEGLHDVNRNARRIMDYCIEIHRLENVADEQSRLALARLFRGTDALYALKWKEIYDHVENAIDKCEDVATILEGIVVKHT